MNKLDRVVDLVGMRIFGGNVEGWFFPPWLTRPLGLLGQMQAFLGLCQGKSKDLVLLWVGGFPEGSMSMLMKLLLSSWPVIGSDLPRMRSRRRAFSFLLFVPGPLLQS